MFQVFFLTVLTNFFAGVALTFPFLKEKVHSLDHFSFIFESETFKVWLGVATFVTGLLSLFKFYQFDIIIIGDLLPSSTALTAGAILIIRYVMGKNTFDDESTFIHKVYNFGEKYGTIVGLLAIVAAVLHLILPSAVIL